MRDPGKVEIKMLNLDYGMKNYNKLEKGMEVCFEIMGTYDRLCDFQASGILEWLFSAECLLKDFSEGQIHLKYIIDWNRYVDSNEDWRIALAKYYNEKKFNNRYILDDEGIEIVNYYALENAKAVIVNERNIFVL